MYECCEVFLCRRQGSCPDQLFENEVARLMGVKNPPLYLTSLVEALERGTQRAPWELAELMCGEALQAPLASGSGCKKATESGSGCQKAAESGSGCQKAAESGSGCLAQA